MRKPAETPSRPLGNYSLIHEDAAISLPRINREYFDLIYIDPPFNTGKTQKRTALRTQQDAQGDRTGYKGQRYKTTTVGELSYEDKHEDYLGFLRPLLQQAHRILTPNGSLFVHLDYHEVHYVKVALDEIFGRDSFINEIIWAYDYGARSRSRWSTKHDNILWYAKDPKNYIFNYDAVERIPYMAPDLVGEEKAARGKTLTDTWWHTIVGTNSKEKTGYPTQKPVGLLSRIVKVHSNPGSHVCDFFAGSGSFGVAAVQEGRHAVCIDNNVKAIDIMSKRFRELDACGLVPRIEL